MDKVIYSTCRKVYSDRKKKRKEKKRGGKKRLVAAKNRQCRGTSYLAQMIA